MKKLFLSIGFLVFASLFMFLQAQTEKVITITKKTTDAKGNVTVEETILTGKDAKNVDIQEYIEEATDDLEIDVEVNIEEILSGAKDINIDGEDVHIFKLDGNGSKNLNEILETHPDLSDDVKEKLKGIQLGNLEGLEGTNEQKRIIIMSDEGQVGFKNADKVEYLNNEEHKIVIISGDDREIIFEDLDEMMIEGDEFNWNGGENTFTFKSLGEEDGSSKTFLGVWPGEATHEKGVLLGGIVNESAAAKAGLKEGDIITSIGGKTTKTFSELAAIIKEYEPNDNVVIQYIRNEETRSANVTLGEKKEEKSISYFFGDDDRNNNFSKEERFMRGMKPSCCQKSNEVEKAYIGIMIEDADRGVKIVQVNREDDVLSTEDIITKFGKQKVNDANELINEVSKYNPGDRVKVQYSRDGKNRKSKVTLLGRMVKECCTNSACCSSKDDKKISTTKTEIIIKKQKSSGIKSDLGNSLLELQEVNLFPNPTEGSFALEFTSEDTAPINISITDSNGREIIKDEISDFDGKYSGNFNLKGNTPGLYLVNIIQSGKVLTKKVIVK